MRGRKTEGPAASARALIFHLRQFSAQIQSIWDTHTAVLELLPIRRGKVFSYEPFCVRLAPWHCLESVRGTGGGTGHLQLKRKRGYNTFDIHSLVEVRLIGGERPHSEKSRAGYKSDEPFFEHSCLR